MLHNQDSLPYDEDVKGDVPFPKLEFACIIVAMSGLLAMAMSVGSMGLHNVSVRGGWVADTKLMIEQAYTAFNLRDINGALALMTEDVSWPKASEGGRVVGKEEIRAYWTRQWNEFDPHVKPLAMTDDGDRIRVRVHQVVRNLEGTVLADSEVVHVFTVHHGLIAAMNLGDDPESVAGPSAAFAHRS